MYPLLYGIFVICRRLHNKTPAPGMVSGGRPPLGAWVESEHFGLLIPPALQTEYDQHDTFSSLLTCCSILGLKHTCTLGVPKAAQPDDALLHPEAFPLPSVLFSWSSLCCYLTTSEAGTSSDLVIILLRNNSGSLIRKRLHILAFKGSHDLLRHF